MYFCRSMTTIVVTPPLQAIVILLLFLVSFHYQYNNNYYHNVKDDNNTMPIPISISIGDSSNDATTNNTQFYYVEIQLFHSIDRNQCGCQDELPFMSIKLPIQQQQQHYLQQHHHLQLDSKIMTTTTTCYNLRKMFPNEHFHEYHEIFKFDFYYNIIIHDYKRSYIGNQTTYESTNGSCTGSIHNEGTYTFSIPTCRFETSPWTNYVLLCTYYSIDDSETDVDDIPKVYRYE